MLLVHTMVSRADLEMGRIQAGEGCLCCPRVLLTSPGGQGHFLCLQQGHKAISRSTAAGVDWKLAQAQPCTYREELARGMCRTRKLEKEG